MKNLVITIIIFTMSFATANVQIKKTKTNTKLSTKTSTSTFKGNKPVIYKGLKVSNINNLSSDKIKNLKIPKYNISLAKLNASAVRTWKINPIKPFDGNLKLESFYGLWRSRAWSTEDLPRDYSTVEESRGLRNDGFQIHANSKLFPLSLAFTASRGAEYRLKIKSGRDGPLDHPYSVYIVVNSFVSQVDLNAQGEFNYIFSVDTSRPIDIHISSYTANLVSHGAISVYSEIKIDRIDN